MPFDAATLSRQMLSKLDAHVKALGTESESVLKALRPAYTNIGAYVAAHQKAHEAVVSKIGTQRAVAKQIGDLQNTCAVEKDKIAQLAKRIAAVGDLNKTYRDARVALKKSIDDQTTSLKQFAARIEELSDGSISVAIADEGDLSDVYSALESLGVRTRSQEAVRTRKFGEQVAVDGVWKTLDKLATEVGTLLRP